MKKIPCQVLLTISPVSIFPQNPEKIMKYPGSEKKMKIFELNIGFIILLGLIINNLLIS